MALPSTFAVLLLLAKAGPGLAARTAGDALAQELVAQDMLTEEQASAQSNDMPKDIGLYWKKVSKLSPALKNYWEFQQELGLGSFGAVYRAKVVNQKACSKCVVGESYAIKVFFSSSTNMPLARVGTLSESEEDGLAEVVEECAKAETIKGQDDLGMHIMGCVADRVSEQASNGARVLYVVTEDGGGALGAFWKVVSERDPLALQLIFVDLVQQSMMALGLVAKRHYIHHDVKMSNMVVKFVPSSNDVPLLKLMLIDWGAAVRVTENGHKDEYTVSNVNGPPEWAVLNYAYSPQNPDGFDVFTLANLIVELMTGEAMVEIVYIAREKIFPERATILNRRRWCGERRYRDQMCRVMHRMAMFTKAISERPLTAEIMIDYVNFARGSLDSSLMMKVWDGLLTSVKDEFYKFLEVLAKMFSFKAQDRPTFAAIHESNVTQELAWGVQVQENKAHAQIVDKVKQKVAQGDNAILVEAFRDARPYFGIGDTTQQNVGSFTHQSIQQSFMSGGVKDIEDGPDDTSTFTQLLCEGLCGYGQDPVQPGPFVVFKFPRKRYELADVCMDLCQQDTGCRNFAITPQVKLCYLFTFSDPHSLAKQEYMKQYMDTLRVSQTFANEAVRLRADIKSLTKCLETTAKSICYQRDSALAARGF